MGKRGGRHQQKRQADAAPEVPSEPSGRQEQQQRRIDTEDVSSSPLASLLLQYWAWGQMSAPMLQAIALAAVRSGPDDPHVQAMAKFGTYGRQQQNIQRSILQAYCPQLCTPEPYEVMVPMLVKQDTDTVTQQVPLHMFLPHEWLHCLHKANVAEEILGLDHLREFWQGQSGEDPKLALNAFLQSEEDRVNKVPLLLHGDGGQHQKRDTLMIVSFRSILSQLPIEQSQMLLAALPKKCRVHAKSLSLDADQDTWHVIWKVLTWSFTAAWHGRHPDTNHRGEPWPAGSSRALMAGQPIFAQGKGAVLWVLAGDQDYQANEKGLPRSSSNFPAHTVALVRMKTSSRTSG
jgi:hypothetical protein